MLRIGLISDTHGLLRPEARLFLQGCNAIIHTGDIGHPYILEELTELAPVTAVRGNTDIGLWADTLRETELIKMGEILVYAIHDLGRLRIHPASEGIRVVVYGHSHNPQIAERDGVLYVNPGSAGPRRFRLPIALGELIIDGDAVTARTVELEG